MRSSFRLAPVEGVAPGAVATLRLPGPRQYHAVQLVGLAIADVEWIRVMGNNRPTQEYTAEALNVFNKFDGLTDWDGTSLMIPMDQTGMKKRDHEEMTALNVGSPEIDPRTGAKTGVMLSTAEIHIKIKDTATDPAVTAQYAIISPAIFGEIGKARGGPGVVRSVFRLPGIQGSSGRWDFEKLPKGTRATPALSRLFIKANNITELEIERDQRTVFERTKVLNDFILANAKRAPQSGWYIVDFTENGYGENRLFVGNAQDLRLKFTSSAAETVEIYAEYIGELEA